MVTFSYKRYSRGGGVGKKEQSLLDCQLATAAQPIISLGLTGLKYTIFQFYRSVFSATVYFSFTG